MNDRGDHIKRSVSAAIALLSFALSVAVPVMERGALVGDTAVESQHDPDRCAHAHDHRVCTQVGANLSLASGESHRRLPDVLVHVVFGGDVQPTPKRSTCEGPPSRAPPLA